MPDLTLATPDLLGRFDVFAPELVEKTQIATVWKVRQADGSPAALKVYPAPGMGSEAPGFDLLAALDGNGAARLLARHGDAVLIEWLDGPSLGDLTRQGQDDLATWHLLDVALRLHAAPLPAHLTLPDLSDWFADLFALTLAPDCPPRAVADITRCKALAATLLADPRDVRPLHGDLHHDNIRRGARGFCAFDAKGVRGERAYELANAFRNPKGADATVRNPGRIAGLASAWAAALGVDRHRVLAWAAVKSALSVAWRSKGGALSFDPEFDLLTQLLTVLDDGPTPPPPSS